MYINTGWFWINRKRKPETGNGNRKRKPETETGNGNGNRKRTPETETGNRKLVTETGNGD